MTENDRKRAPASSIVPRRRTGTRCSAHFSRVFMDSSSWATDDEEHQARTYHAPGVRRIPFSRARFHWRYAQAVARSPLPLADRLGLAWFLFKKVGYDSPVIAREALTEVRARLPRGG